MLAAVLCILAASCARTAPPPPAASAPAPYDHVVVLGFDGLAGVALDSAKAIPHMRGLMERGSWTTRKRSVLPTTSAPNWASMLMGVGPEGTGYTAWDSRSASFPPAEDGGVPTVFTLLASQRPDAMSACCYQWDGIAHVVDSASVRRREQFPISDDGSLAQLDWVRKVLKEDRPALGVFVWDYPDHVGHAVGWYTGTYYDSVSSMDSVVGEVVRALEEAGMSDSTLLVVTSDHGGHRTVHGKAVAEDVFSPLLLWGRYARPAARIPGPVYQYDVAATIAAALGLERPSSWRGVPVQEAFGGQVPGR